MCPLMLNLDEQKVTELHNAGIFADDFELTHKKSGQGAQSYSKWSGKQSGKTSDKSSVGTQGQGQGQTGSSSNDQGQNDRKSFNKDIDCYHCHAKRHTKPECR